MSLISSGHCTGLCPKALAWVGKPYSVDQAHVEMECSNRGHCDRQTVNSTLSSLQKIYCFDRDILIHRESAVASRDILAWHVENVSETSIQNFLL